MSEASPLAVALMPSGRSDADLRECALGVVGFDAEAERADRCVNAVVLPFPLLGSALAGSLPTCEVWRVRGGVERGRHGAIQFAKSGDLLWAHLALDEAAFAGDIDAVAQSAYAHLHAFLNDSGFPHLLRVWNYFGAITQGEGDAERYKQFCVGRARTFQAGVEGFPAATAIGFPTHRQTFHLLWLAGRSPGVAIENPRQVSAYLYPPQYGPQAPGFARATLVRQGGVPILLISGTAAVVGHASCHEGDLMAQLEETARNLQTLLETARAHAPELPAQFEASSVLRVYLRDPAQQSVVEAFLRARWPLAQWVVLHAEVCRPELLIEIDAVHRPAD